MIKYPEDLFINKHMEHKCGKERKKALEEVLRTIGNFDEDKPIIIEDYEVETYSDIIFKIKDKDNTIFSFLSFGVGPLDDGTNRYQKSFYLTMQRENSKFVYKYDFSNLIHKLDFNDNFEVIEVNYPLSETRILKVKTGRYRLINLEIEETSKRYVINTYSNYKNEDDIDHELPLLENLEIIIDKAKKIDELNLESIMSIINKEIEISSCYIYSNDKKLANISFLNDEIKSYEIVNENVSIHTNVYSDKIERKTERKIDADVIKNEEVFTEENYEIIQSDIKKLMKTM